MIQRLNPVRAWRHHQYRKLLRTPRERGVYRDKFGNVTVVISPLRLELQAIRNLEGEYREEFLRTGRLPAIGGAAPGAWTFTNATRTNILNAVHDFDSDTHKMALLTSASNIGAASTTHAGVTGEHANQGAPGYETGGAAITLTLAGTITVTCDIDTDPTWTATGGNIVARWAELYEVGGNVIAYALLEAVGPADVTVTTGNILTVAAHASGVFTLA